MNRAERRATWLAEHRRQTQSPTGRENSVEMPPTPAASTHHDGPASIVVHIERVVLHGFESYERYGIGRSLEKELTRLIGERGIPPAMTNLGSADRLDAGAFQIPRGAPAQFVGIQVAQSLIGAPPR